MLIAKNGFSNRRKYETLSIYGSCIGRIEKKLSNFAQNFPTYTRVYTVCQSHVVKKIIYLVDVGFNVVEFLPEVFHLFLLTRNLFHFLGPSFLDLESRSRFVEVASGQ